MKKLIIAVCLFWAVNANAQTAHYILANESPFDIPIRIETQAAVKLSASSFTVRHHSKTYIDITFDVPPKGTEHSFKIIKEAHGRSAEKEIVQSYITTESYCREGEYMFFKDMTLCNWESGFDFTETHRESDEYLITLRG